MADFTALKTAIQNAIKQNGNEEITGNLLQDVLLAIVTTLGDGSINNLISALNTESNARQLGDSTLQGNINTVTSAITSINYAIANGCVYAGIATPTGTPATGRVFYLALTAGTYTNYGNKVVTQGINILRYNGSAWSLDVIASIDDAPTPSSNNLIKSGGAFDFVMTNGSAFDLSAYNNGTTYADLNAALTALNALPAAYKKGGMSMKFVQTYDNNYIQARCMSDEFTTDVTKWQGVDYEPTAGSKNLVESGGVYAKTTIPNSSVEEVVKAEYKGYLDGDGEFVSTPNATNRCTGYIKVSEGEVVRYRGGWTATTYPLVVGYTDLSTGAVSLLKSATAITKEIIIPSGIKYIRAWGDISLISNEDVTITHKGLYEKLSNLSSLLSISDEENVDLYLRKYDISKFPWKYGWIYTDGIAIQYNDYPKYIYSNFFIPVKKDIKLNLTYVSAAKIKVDLYDLTKVFVKRLGGFFTSHLTEVTPDADGYIRISLVNDSGFDITQLSSFVIEQDEATIDERIGLIEEKIMPISTIYNGTLDGYLNASGEFVAASGNKCTEYIPVVEGQKVYYSGKWNGTQFPLMCGYSDTSGNNMTVLIPSDGTLITKIITIPSGVNYIRAWSGNNVQLLLKAYEISTRRMFYVDQSGNGDFESLADALAIINDSASNPITLIVRAGTYTMPKQLFGTPWYTPSNRYISIIGTDKSNCIIKNTYGYYSTTYPNYDSACLRLAGNIYIANLTFISSDEDYSGEAGHDDAYCLHLDFNTDGGVCEINNCKLINTHGGSCIGFGTRNNYEIKLVNCEMICEQATSYGTIWGHNGDVENPVGNKFTMINCIVKGADAKAVKILSAYDSQPVVAEFIGNAVFGTDGQNAAALSDNITKSSYSCLNNISVLNS